jgi:hypothetical protein
MRLATRDSLSGTVLTGVVKRCRGNHPDQSFTMDKRDLFYASLREVNSAFDAVNIVRRRCGKDSLKFAKAHEHYRIAVLKRKADRASLVADGALALVPGVVGRGRRLLVLQHRHEPVAESIFTTAGAGVRCNT